MALGAAPVSTTIVGKIGGLGGVYEDEVFIGRPGFWGNPFKMGRDGAREEVVRKYEAMILTRPDMLARLPELRGKRLMCYCAPLPCHGDVLARLADEGVP